MPAGNTNTTTTTNILILIILIIIFARANRLDPDQEVHSGQGIWSAFLDIITIQF